MFFHLLCSGRLFFFDIGAAHREHYRRRPDYRNL